MHAVAGSIRLEAPSKSQPVGHMAAKHSACSLQQADPGGAQRSWEAMRRMPTHPPGQTPGAWARPPRCQAAVLHPPWVGLDPLRTGVQESGDTKAGEAGRCEQRLRQVHDCAAGMWHGSCPSKLYPTPRAVQCSHLLGQWSAGRTATALGAVVARPRPGESEKGGKWMPGTQIPARRQRAHPLISGIASPLPGPTCAGSRFAPPPAAARPLGLTPVRRATAEAPAVGGLEARFGATGQLAKMGRTASRNAQ